MSISPQSVNILQLLYKEAGEREDGIIRREASLSVQDTMKKLGLEGESGRKMVSRSYDDLLRLKLVTTLNSPKRGIQTIYQLTVKGALITALEIGKQIAIDDSNHRFKELVANKTFLRQLGKRKMARLVTELGELDKSGVLQNAFKAWIEGKLEDSPK